LKEPIQNRKIFAEIDILTLSVTQFLIVGSQWKAFEKIFPMRSKNLKSSHGQDQDMDFRVSNYFREKSTPWPCQLLDFWLSNLIGLSNELRTRSQHRFPTSMFDFHGNQHPDLVCDWIFDCWTSMESSWKDLSNEVWQSKIEPRTRSGHQFSHKSFFSRKNDALTLSVARFFIVKPHWNFGNKIIFNNQPRHYYCRTQRMT